MRDSFQRHCERSEEIQPNKFRIALMLTKASAAVNVPGTREDGKSQINQADSG
jgi:hypothetical protein